MITVLVALLLAQPCGVDACGVPAPPTVILTPPPPPPPPQVCGSPVFDFCWNRGQY